MSDNKKEVLQESIISGFMLGYAIIFLINMSIYFLRSKLVVFDKKGLLRKRDYELELQDIIKKKHNVKIYIQRRDQGVFNAYAVFDDYIVITQSLEQHLNKREIMAIILHEYGHIINKHVVKSYVAYNFSVLVILGIFNILLNITGAFSATNTFYRILLNIVIVIFGANVADIITKRTVGRRYEYIADSYSKKFGYERDMKSALKKLDVYLRKVVCRSVSDNNIYGAECDKLIERIHTLDEHPPTKNRLEKLSLRFIIPVLKKANPSNITSMLNGIKKLFNFKTNILNMKKEEVPSDMISKLGK